MATWVKGKLCYRCGNDGIIPLLRIRSTALGAKTIQSEIMSCDCEKGEKKKFPRYAAKYGDSHQFPFTLEIATGCEPHMTYGEVFLIYQNNIRQASKKSGKIEVDVSFSVIEQYLKDTGRMRRTIAPTGQEVRKWWI